MSLDGNSNINPPLEAEIEISVFGPGYGESILIHFGSNQWIIIDSCTNNNNRTAALEYLVDIGVDCKECVKYIVITHWHDDHIRGISNIVRECSNAKVSISSALQCEEFLNLISCYRDEPCSSGNGTQELSLVLKMLRNSDRIFLTLENQTLFKKTINNVDCKVTALSPSTEAVIQSKRDIARLIPEFSQDKRVVRSPKQNHSAIALFVSIGDLGFLLGSDLEDYSDDKIGWKRVIKNNTLIGNKKSDFFKIPHHGSSNGHNADVWEKLLVENPTCAITPFKRLKEPIPKKEDLKRIYGLTNNAYITENPDRKKFKHHNNTVKKIFDKNFKSVSYFENSSGQIRFRKNLESDTNFKIDLFGSAFKITQDSI